MLNINMLQRMPDGCIFATGEGHYPRLYNAGIIRWIAKRGEGYWAYGYWQI